MASFTTSRRVSLAMAFFVLPASFAAAKPEALLVKSAHAHVGDGTVLAGGAVLVRDGRIAAVGQNLQAPEGADVIAIAGGAITPGLIDANARLEPLDTLSRLGAQSEPSSERTARAALADFFRGRARGSGDSGTGAGPGGAPGAVEEPERRNERRPGIGGIGRFDGGVFHDEKGHGHDGNGPCKLCGGTLPAPSAVAAAPFATGVVRGVRSEQSSEIIPHTRIADGLNLNAVDLVRLVRGGVTTVYASPDSSAVVGPRGAIVRTAGPVAERLVQPNGAVKAVLGSDPTRVGSHNVPARGYSNVSMYTRRPTTRMGVTWVFRKAFYDALARERGREVSGADTASPEASLVLSRVLKHEVPLRIQARMRNDIATAFRLAREFDLRFVLEEATDAMWCLPLIKEDSVPVIFGPIEAQRPTGLRRMTNETRDARLYTFAKLIAAGVPTALSAQDLRAENGLARQAMYAIRFGATPEQALQAVTSTPAAILGIDKDTGTLENGKRADLVVWSGRPFASTSRPVVVIVGGQIVVDHRS